MRISPVNFKSTFVPNQLLREGLDFALETKDSAALKAVKSILDDGKDHKIELKYDGSIDQYSITNREGVKVYLDNNYHSSVSREKSRSSISLLTLNAITNFFDSRLSKDEIEKAHAEVTERIFG